MSAFNPNESMGGLISKTKWYIKTFFNKKIKENGLSITVEQWSLLIIIFKTPGISQTEIAKISLKDKTNVTRILDILEKNTFIKREKDKNDRRSYRIFLTNEGEKILNQLFPIADAVDKTCCENISDEELLKLKSLLYNVCSTLKNYI